MPDFNVKMHQNRFRLRLRPRFLWRSLQRFPRPPSWIYKGLLLREGKGRRAQPVCFLVSTILARARKEDWKSLLPSGLIFQQDKAPAYTAKLAQNWITTNCSDFIRKDEWPSNLPDLNPLHYHVCLNATRYFNPSQIPSTSWRKSCKQYGMIYHRTPSTRPYWALSKDFELVWKQGGGHFEHVLK